MKKFTLILVIPLLFSLVLSSGVVLASDDNEEGESSIVSKILPYLANRMLDFLDIFRLNVAVGPGIGLNVRATKFAQIGAETYVSARAGLGKNSGLLVKRYGLLYTESEILTGGVGMLYTGGDQRGLTEVGITAHLGLIGAEAAIDFSEIADFFLGILTIDHKDDDWELRPTN